MYINTLYKQSLNLVILLPIINGPIRDNLKILFYKIGEEFASMSHDKSHDIIFHGTVTYFNIQNVVIYIGSQLCRPAVSPLFNWPLLTTHYSVLLYERQENALFD